ncbi:protein of unknown function [Methylococcus capsulatus]|uniref:Uncharacterized protein n=1 Tax=Methylococcus capsulatus TaxID=414 RepID=A0AA35Y1G2_METCP|nr:protein of unknown function [Methylococcus capsulatus]
MQMIFVLNLLGRPVRDLTHSRQSTFFDAYRAEDCCRKLLKTWTHSDTRRSRRGFLRTLEDSLQYMCAPGHELGTGRHS